MHTLIRLISSWKANMLYSICIDVAHVAEDQHRSINVNSWYWNKRAVAFCLCSPCIWPMSWKNVQPTEIEELKFQGVEDIVHFELAGYLRAKKEGLFDQNLWTTYCCMCWYVGSIFQGYEIIQSNINNGIANWWCM